MPKVLLSFDFTFILCLQWKKSSRFVYCRKAVLTPWNASLPYYTWLHWCCNMIWEEDLHSRHSNPKPRIQLRFLDRIVLGSPILYFVFTRGAPQWNSLFVNRWALCSGSNRKAGLWFVFCQLLCGMILGCLGNSAWLLTMLIAWPKSLTWLYWQCPFEVPMPVKSSDNAFLTHSRLHAVINSENVRIWARGSA